MQILIDIYIGSFIVVSDSAVNTNWFYEYALQQTNSARDVLLTRSDTPERDRG